MRLRGVRILVVEDNLGVGESFSELLREEGAEVVSVTTGREAAAAFEAGPFDLVLADFGLPDIAGDLLIRHFRAVSKEVRVAVVTGYGEPLVTRARQAGADVVFVKPLQWTSVLDYLRSTGLGEGEVA
jgi:CheY-like chemotaxis protein